MRARELEEIILQRARVTKAGNVAGTSRLRNSNFSFMNLKRFLTGFLILKTLFVLHVAVAESNKDESADNHKAAASDEKDSKDKNGKKRTKIDFEDQLIEGRATKPELFVMLQNRLNNSRRLFKLRENFIPELRKTAEDTSRGGK